MNHPMTEPNAHLTTEQLVTLALDEVRRLCLGPSQRGGRRWTMCVPVQVDDSDVLIAGALRRQAADITKLVDDHHAAGHRIAELHGEVERSKERMRLLERRIDGFNERDKEAAKAITAGGIPTTAEQVPARILQMLELLAKLQHEQPKAV